MMGHATRKFDGWTARSAGRPIAYYATNRLTMTAMIRARASQFGVAATTIVIFAIILTACGKSHDVARAPYLPLSDVEATYGKLITAGNHPTPDQHGTGERVGIFQDATGNIWGLPLTIKSDGTVFACAPERLRDAKITGTIPGSSVVVGSTNEPTGWRGGTGDLELLLRDPQGTIHWQAVHSAALAEGPVCWAPESPGPAQRLQYYRLARADAGNR
jgi:hypothetical protein